MSEPSLNQKLAEALGWTQVEWYEDNAGPAILCGYPPTKVGVDKAGEWEAQPARHSVQIPNYCTDLNACHEAEKGLTHEQWAKFRQVLFPIAAGNDAGDFERNLLPKLPAGFTRGRAYHCASAHHRALALLKTLSS